MFFHTNTLSRPCLQFFPLCLLFVSLHVVGIASLLAADVSAHLSAIGSSPLAVCSPATHQPCSISSLVFHPLSARLLPQLLWYRHTPGLSGYLSVLLVLIPRLYSFSLPSDHSWSDCLLTCLLIYVLFCRCHLCQ